MDDLTEDQIRALLLADPSPQTLVWALVLMDIAQNSRQITAAEMHPRLMKYAGEVQATRMTGELHTMMEFGNEAGWPEAIRMFKRRRKLILGEEMKAIKKATKKAAKKATVLQLVPKPKAG